MKSFTESTIEQAAIDWLRELGYNYAFGPEIAFDGVVRVVRLWDGVSLFVLGRGSEGKVMNDELGMLQGK